MPSLAEGREPLSSKGRLAILGASLVLGMLVFLYAYIGMNQYTGLGVLDQPLLSWMLLQRNSTVTDVMEMVSTVADPSVLAGIVITCAVVWAFVKREIIRPTLLIAAMGLAAATSTLLKIVLMNPRPPLADMVLPYEADYSFPSGHTLGMLVFLLVLGYLVYSRRFDRGRFCGWTVFAFLAAATVASSRLYLGYHWVTDVVASFGLGFIILAMVVIADELVSRHLGGGGRVALDGDVGWSQD